MQKRYLNSLVAVLSIAACASVTACSGSSNSNATNPAKPGAKAGTPNNGSDSNNKTGAPVQPGTSDPNNNNETNTPPPYLGTVSATLTGSGAATLTAGFVASSSISQDTQQNCAGTQSGACCLIPADTPPPSAPDVQLVAAGTIKVTDGTHVATVNPTSMGTMTVYEDNSSTDNSLRWAAGDTLTISAAGGVVHAFSGTIDVPSAPSGITPQLDKPIARASALQISWTPRADENATVALTITALRARQFDGMIQCGAQDSDGSITVPQELLAGIDATDTASIGLARTASAIVTSDNAAVTLSATAIASANSTFSN